jgi:hypothetical protein
MGGAEEGTETMTEVDCIATKVPTKSTQFTPNTTKTTTKIVHPSTLSTIVELKSVSKTFS